jgi:DNA ligase-3
MSKKEIDESGAFLQLQTLIEEIASNSKHTDKTKVIAKFLKTFEGDVYKLFRLLLCKEDKRVYNVREKVFVKLLSQIFNCSEKEMITDLEQGDIGKTTKKFFVASGQAKSKSTLTLNEVDDWLDELTKYTKEEQQIRHFEKILVKATGSDLYYLAKIIDHDLKVMIGPKYALEALHPDAFKAYKVTNDLKSIITKTKKYELESNGKPDLLRKMSLTIDIMVPVKPMLARVSKSCADTVSRCPNGMLCEIKYDGERIQIHKNGDEYSCFSRNLKPVTPHKVADLKEYIPKAFKDAETMIIDSEILLMDSTTKLPLPFGTMGAQKKKQFKDATICLFVFDILMLNGESLMATKMIKRRAILEKNITEIEGRVVLTEIYKPTNEPELQEIFNKVNAKNLEGLVVKDFGGFYEPNMRHWLKLKKEHFAGMGDSADLIVLGAYFGSGSKGGKMSIFLMGVYDEDTKKFRTVVRVGNGFSDAEIDELQTSFKVKKISQDPAKCPDWLNIQKPMLPDFVVVDPKIAPIWEISGAEFSRSTRHTANQISIRFPRVKRVRDDKDWETATSLKELQAMFDLGGINRPALNDDEDDLAEMKDVEMGSAEESEEDDDKKKILSKKSSTKKQAVSSQQNTNISSFFTKTEEKKTTMKRERVKEEDEDNTFVTPPSPQKKLKGQIFSGFRVTSYGDIDEKIKKLVETNGGKFIGEDEDVYFSTMTHMLTQNPWDEVLAFAAQVNPNCLFLAPSWVIDSARQGTKLNYSSYTLKKD